jgi:hypothetical protein
LETILSKRFLARAKVEGYKHIISSLPIDRLAVDLRLVSRRVLIVNFVLLLSSLSRRLFYQTAEITEIENRVFVGEGSGSG